jgi:hypothetical protein
VSTKIRDALFKLDVNNDAHWTSDGLPRLEVVKSLSNESVLTREQLTAAVPGFTRVNAVLPAEDATAAPIQKNETAAAAPKPAATPWGAPVVSDAPVKDAPASDEEKQVLADDLQDARGQLAQAEADLKSVIAAKDELDRRYHEAQKRVDQAQLKIEKAGGQETSQQAIAGYHARQRQLLADKAAKTQQWKEFTKETGLKLKDVIPQGRSALDAAMSRKNTRGTGRPGAK